MGLGFLLAEDVEGGGSGDGASLLGDDGAGGGGCEGEGLCHADGCDECDEEILEHGDEVYGMIGYIVVVRKTSTALTHLDGQTLLLSITPYF